MRRSKRLRLTLALMVLSAYALAVLLTGPTIERLGISGLWYVQDRLDLASYTYVNASAELADPANVSWIMSKTGY